MPISVSRCRMVPLRVASLVSLCAVACGASHDSTKTDRKFDPPVFGGEPVKKAFDVWLSVWRNLYVDPGTDNVPLLEDDALPDVFRGVAPKVVLSAGGAAGGVVTEGMGYALMLEGMQAVRGDGWAKELGTSIMRSWMGMVQGSDPEEIVGGAATWKFPKDLCAAKDPWEPCHGSAADGDVDAVLGMIYLVGAHGYPEDFVDVVMRAVISFASADLGFPDMYRTLKDGKKVFVPKAGSQWGGLTPPKGRFETKGPAWCYNPAYFAPAHYRTFRDFAKKHWKPKFDDYLPTMLDGHKTSLDDLVAAFDGAVLAGYNILFYSSCESGTVANWVGVQAECANDDTLACEGVPWEHTPYVGKDAGECSTSGTKWGAFGADATRTFWRVAMDYVLYTEESENVDIYWRSGWVNQDISFNARTFLNRVATQYKRYGVCDGGTVGGCDCQYPGCIKNETKGWMLNEAWAVDKWPRTPGLTCANVPHHGQAWWAGFMSYPTFTAFVAPYRGVEVNKTLSMPPMVAQQNQNWMNTFAFLCNFSNFTAEGNWQITGKVCQRTYFHVSQEAIATMIMSGSLSPVPAIPHQQKGKENTSKEEEKAHTKQGLKKQSSEQDAGDGAVTAHDRSEGLLTAVMRKSDFGVFLMTAASPLGSAGAMISVSCLALVALGSVVLRRRYSVGHLYAPTSDLLIDAVEPSDAI